MTETMEEEKIELPKYRLNKQHYRRLNLFGKPERPNYRSMAQEEQDLARARLNLSEV